MRHWDDETNQAATIFFDGLTTTEIRRRQGLCQEQIAAVHDEYARNGTRKDDTLADLRAQEQALTDSMLRRCYYPERYRRDGRLRVGETTPPLRVI